MQAQPGKTKKIFVMISSDRFILIMGVEVKAGERDQLQYYLSKIVVPFYRELIQFPLVIQLN